jgi:cytidylate kinase
VTNNTFYIARAPEIREIMVRWQREIGEKQNIVTEGRDVGTVVFPQAARKFYLDADFEERAHRRILELNDKGKTFSEEDLKKELHDRDQKDFTRRVGPLKKAEDAIVIDSTNMTVGEVVEKIMEYL